MKKYLDSHEEFLFFFLYVFFKRKYFVLAIALATFAGVIFGTYLMTPMWKATAKVQIQMNPQNQLALFKDLATPAPVSPDINPANNLIQIATGRSLAEEVVKIYRRDEMLQKRTENPESGRDIIAYYLKKILIKTPIAILAWTGLLDPQPDNYLADAVKEFREDLLDVKLEEDTEVLNVSIWGETTQSASDMANTTVRLLKEKVLKSTRNPIEETYFFTEKQLEEVEKELRVAQDALRRFKEEMGVIDINEQQRTLIQRLDGLELDLAEAGSAIVEKEERLREAEKQLSTQTEMILSQEVVGNNPLVMESKSQIQDLEVRLAAVKLEKTEYHPDVMSLVAEIAEYREKLKSELERIVQTATRTVNPVYEDLVEQLVSLEIDRFALMGREQALNDEISRVRQELALFPAKEMGMARLTNQVDIKQTTYNNLKSKLDELRVLKETTTSNLNLNVIDEALVYDYVHADWPMWVLNLPAGLIGSILLGLGIAFFAEYWDTSYKTLKELEEDLELPVRGSLPDFGKSYGDAGYREEPEIKIAFDKLADALLLGSDREGNRTFMVSSANPGEGRTTTAVNISVALRERGKSVLLLESDLRNPAIARLMKIEDDWGLADAIAGGASLNDAVREVNGISILPAGRPTELTQPVEVLSSNSFEAFLSESRDRYDVIVIDAPAIKTHKDSLVLSPLADETLLIAETNKTQRRSILMANKRIQEAGGTLAGIILNKQINPIPAFILDILQ